MSLSAGLRLGPYEIVAPLGVGGMGEVYRATDSRLGRDVAVKVLPATFAGDSDRRVRFEREARAVAALSHPNILAIFDVGAHDGQMYIVTELLDGQSLRSRLDGGALPVRKSIEVAIQLARGLAAAHDKGIVHRDLKPENVFLLANGLVKILDFGLARATPSGTGLTETVAPVTDPGTTIGTVGYMSPEQVRGEPVDARTDLFALGAVLYEMVSGGRAFKRPTAAETMTAILHDDPPDIAGADGSVPSAIDGIVRHCLEKQASERFQSARDLAFALQSFSGGSASQASMTAVAPSASVRRRTAIAWSVAAVALLIAAGATWRAWRGVQEIGSTSAQSGVTQFTVPPAPKTSLQDGLAVSPDGRNIAFIASSGGTSHIWIKPLDSLEPRMLADTARPQNHTVFWSPDSASLGFFADGKLKKVSIAGGLAQSLCDAPSGTGATWSRDGEIVFAASSIEGLSRVSSAGGRPVPVTTLDASRQETSHRWPSFLPDGRHFLYLSRSSRTENTGVFVTSLDDPTHRTLVVSALSNATYVAPGYVLFVREGSLMAQPFDAATLKVTSDASRLAEDVSASTTGMAMLGRFSASNTGMLVYRSDPASDRQLAWFDRTGKELSRLAPIEKFGFVRLSPDGTRAAVGLTTRGKDDIYILDLARGTLSRLTSDPGNAGPGVWSPDGAYIAFCSMRAGHCDTYQKPTSGVGDEELLHKSDVSTVPADWSADERFLLVAENNPQAAWHLSLLPLSGDRTLAAIIQTQFDSLGARLSPDGKWIAYTSNETGRTEIYVQPFPPSSSGRKSQITTGGGTQLHWRRDGNELIYLRGETIMAVSLKQGAADGAPIKLFDRPVGATSHDVSADGQRFLMNVPAGAVATEGLTVVANWTGRIGR